jgi:hypothetical protein
MASIGKVTMEMDKDILWLFRATRVMICTCGDCINHHNNHIEDGESWDCALKSITMERGGRCGYYQPKETTNAR